jgi:V8-like Glu-specific endopeptidase
MKRALTMVLALLLATPVAAETHGKNEYRIVGGNQASNSQFYGVVGLVFKGGSPDDLLCTGTLIAPKVVLTASHCFHNMEGTQVVVQANELEVAYGAVVLAQATQQQRVDVAKIVVHSQYLKEQGQQYDPSGMATDNDIAFVILSKPITNYQIIPILPESEYNSVLTKGRELIVSGYGLTSLDGPEIPPTLFTAKTPFSRHNNKEFIAGGENLPDTCNGDSGGPAYVMVNQQIYLVGETSRAVLDGQLVCGSGGIYTLGGPYMQWIQQNAAGEYNPANPNPTPPGPSNPGPSDPDPNDPGTDDPGTDNPGTDDPGTDNPGTDNPGTDNPGPNDPGPNDPGTNTPGPGATPPATNPPTPVAPPQGGCTMGANSPNQGATLAMTLFSLLGLLMVGRRRRNHKASR